MSARSFDISKLNKKQSNILVYREFTTGAICVDLHNTTVAKIHLNNSIELNSGGYKTPTTKVAMNRALSQARLFAGYAVVQKKGNWFVSAPDNSLIPFVDGMSINL